MKPDWKWLVIGVLVGVYVVPRTPLKGILPGA